ncbi:sugar-transfer associated ATP-grasp domain-containing protein [Flavivirga amylovorans]|uniref:Sugar-transfer associated ATP-grasp domain-containing protein n=1 Tax=Flavivirga amylovorans TaxID=870486 RepID=A0ABT8X2U5_9FLAO|nr:sugar-transfer associated ATP-grasp domain-containing protein [Flavivirga amylovorans]MDO5987895.1 sugar-transfer associated ATP-grasp domain-containing protein [Flavivirga amylovorans]
MASKLKLLGVFFKDKNKKGWLRIFKELLHFAWIKKEIPIDYIRKFLYRKEITDYKNYLSLKEYVSIIESPKMLIPEIASITDNKLSFSLYCRENKLPSPKLISYNLRNTFFSNDTIVLINTKSELHSFFKNVLFKSHKKKLFLKPLDSSGGKGCILLEEVNLKNQIEEFSEALLKNSYVHQEIVIQHPVISKIYSSSVNTLRIDTYIDQQQNIYVLSALMRFGIGGSFIDNASSGGLYVSVNIDTGELKGKGWQDIAKGGHEFAEHPDSKTILNGYAIPFVTESCDLVKIACKSLPNRIVGWDVAITVDGPIIIECNYGPSLHMTDVAYGGYCKHEKIQEILKEIKN